MCFSGKKFWNNCKLEINNEVIHEVEQYKYLGVILDIELSHEKFMKGQLKAAAFPILLRRAQAGALAWACVRWPWALQAAVRVCSMPISPHPATMMPVYGPLVF